jgi:DHA2 family multidrug resistance protein-like MFS transporter
MHDATAALPPQAAEPAGNSVGAALVVASRIGGQAGEALAAAGRAAFTDAMNIAAFVAAAIALVGAVIVARNLPAHHLPLAEEPLAGDDALP